MPKFVSFRPGAEVQAILDDIPHTKKSTFIREAIKHYVLDELPEGATPKGDEKGRRPDQVISPSLLASPGREGSDQDFQEKGSLLEPPTQPKPADASGSSDAGKTASEDQETSASGTTSKSEEKPTTPKPLTTYLHSAASKPKT